MLDIILLAIAALIGAYLLLVIFRQAKENEALRSDIEGVVTANAELHREANASMVEIAHLRDQLDADANGNVSRDPKSGQFVSAKRAA